MDFDFNISVKYNGTTGRLTFASNDGEFVVEAHKTMFVSLIGEVSSFVKKAIKQADRK